MQLDEAPATGAPAALLRACGWTPGPSDGAARNGTLRWERGLPERGGDESLDR